MIIKNYWYGLRLWYLGNEWLIFYRECCNNMDR